MFILRALCIVLSTIFYGSLSIIVSFWDKNGVRQNRFAQLWARALLYFGGVPVTIENLDRIQPGKSYVIASNHLSYMDTPVVLANIPVQFRFIAKRGLFSIPFLGNHLKRAGHIPVPREDPRAAIKTLTLAATIIRERGISILIFPEGGRSADGGLQAFKDGGTFIAIKAGVPIVPVALIGTREILPFGSNRITPGPVTLRVGNPIETSALTIRDRGQVTEQLREQIAEMLAR